MPNNNVPLNEVNTVTSSPVQFSNIESLFPIWEQTQVQVNITGHRGMGVNQKMRSQYHKGAFFYPENSIASFAAAIEQGAEAIECDIHVSKDGEAIVIHGSKIAPYADLISSKLESEPCEPQKKKSLTVETLTKKESLRREELLQQCLLCLPNASHSISIDNILQVEKFTKKELQTLFSLRGYNVEVPSLVIKNKAIPTPGKTGKIFDELTGVEKKKLSPFNKSFIVKAKRQLLSEVPEIHQIPTLVQLLEFVGNENQKRQGTNKPNVKLNIELKGKGSAIATIFTILAFYKNSSNAHYVEPKDIIFLGTRAVGEIVIANAILKRKVNTLRDLEKPIPDLGMSELFTFISDKDRLELFNKYNEQYEKLQRENPHIAQKDRKTFILAQMYNEKMGSREGELRKQLLDSWNKLHPETKPSSKKLTPQERNEETQSIIENIHSRLAPVRTTLMLSTGDLFGSNSVVDEDFNIDRGVTNISNEGFLKIKKALKHYNYDGIDISLFDYCFDVYDALSEAIKEGKLDSSRLILGATAANWRASAQEHAAVSIENAYKKAEYTVQMTSIPLLLKVDEPGCFLALKHESDRTKRTTALTEQAYQSMQLYSRVPSFNRMSNTLSAFTAAVSTSAPHHEAENSHHSHYSFFCSHVVSPICDAAAQASASVEKDFKIREPNQKPARGKISL